jgi:hypothetical protein
MKYAWNNTIPNLAAWNSTEVEEVDLTEYNHLLGDDKWQAEFDGSDIIVD